MYDSMVAAVCRVAGSGWVGRGRSQGSPFGRLSGLSDSGKMMSESLALQLTNNAVD